MLALYVLAALIRLAYYNVTEDELQFCENTPRVYYDGLPVTTVALILPLIYTLRPVMKSGFLALFSATLLITAAAYLLKVKVRKLGMKGMIVAAFCGLGVLAPADRGLERHRRRHKKRFKYSKTGLWPVFLRLSDVVVNERRLIDRIRSSRCGG